MSGDDQGSALFLAGIEGARARLEEARDELSAMKIMLKSGGLSEQQLIDWLHNLNLFDLFDEVIENLRDTDGVTLPSKAQQALMHREAIEMAGKISIAQQIEELTTERTLRSGVYPRLISSGKMRESVANFRNERLEACIATLNWNAERRDDLIRGLRALEAYRIMRDAMKAAMDALKEGGNNEAMKLLGDALEKSDEIMGEQKSEEAKESA